MANILTMILVYLIALVLLGMFAIFYFTMDSFIKWTFAQYKPPNHISALIHSFKKTGRNIK